ncbi:hypothetical protein IUJ58_26270 (plasmid) [Priestia aryabhattai]|uniref:hypothetical protein n=1 Tax=Priestia aryabhattai TaxID=412384 RepID=UPI001C0ABB5A|nr:hypothetical protein [Priestia aryabhattai]MBU3574116.1 hypothetical protein [Priestia aryabhattai]WDL89766.1 hypothetical protein IUJ58_26270 [Priestia aryabhattai]
MKQYKIFLEDEIEKYKFMGVIQSIYPFGCYIYAVVNEEHLRYLIQPFTQISTFKQGIFRSKKKIIIFIHDLYLERVHYFYEISPFIRCVFTDKQIDKGYLKNIKQKQQFLRELKKRKVSHVSIGSHAEWINYYQ